jgi:hypothetical protein
MNVPHASGPEMPPAWTSPYLQFDFFDYGHGARWFATIIFAICRIFTGYLRLAALQAAGGGKTPHRQSRGLLAL